MDRLRAVNDQLEAEARLAHLETQQRLYELEAARQSPATVTDPVRFSLLTVEQTRAARDAATRRRQDVVSGATQIDDWLYRSPR